MVGQGQPVDSTSEILSENSRDCEQDNEVRPRCASSGDDRTKERLDWEVTHLTSSVSVSSYSGNKGFQPHVSRRPGQLVEITTKRHH